MTAWSGRVLTVGEHGVTVAVPMLGGSQEWGPLASSVPDLVVGDQVVVMPIGEGSDRLHVLARLQARQTEQSEVPGLVPRLESIEGVNGAQDARLDGVETVNGQQGGRLTTVESRAGALESRAGVIEGVNTGQNTRLDAVETRNTQQDNRLTATEAKASAAAVDTATVHRTGAESIGGVKTFTDQPVIPAATLATSPIRSDDPRIPAFMCKVKLVGPTGDANTQGFVTTGTGGDVWVGTAAGTWAAQFDPHDMFVAGAQHRIVAPVDGIYRATYRTHYQASTNTTDTLVAFVARGAPASGSTFARDARRCINFGSDGSPLLATNEIDLTAGQSVYWGNWSSVNARIGLGAFPLAGTEITLTYIGPRA